MGTKVKKEKYKKTNLIFKLNTNIEHSFNIAKQAEDSKAMNGAIVIL